MLFQDTRASSELIIGVIGQIMEESPNFFIETVKAGDLNKNIVMVR